MAKSKKQPQLYPAHNPINLNLVEFADGTCLVVQVNPATGTQKERSCRTRAEADSIFFTKLRLLASKAKLVLTTITE